MLLIALPCAGQASPADVRILIDVSGSMKANDPQNLRVPALRLVAELMPNGSRAGVWMFSEGVENLIATGTVDKQWKSSALAALNKIHSRGLFTDIESALAAASADWNVTSEDEVERHIILLTDGVVDVAKDPGASASSRSRIVEHQLARIKRLGAQIHTIALSTKSDRELLNLLAESTEGWAEEVDDAAELQRVFLHMFEQAAKPDTVPLVGNEFKVDNSISEMTLLVFRGADRPPLELVDPNGAPLSAKLASDSVKWREDNGYDLVTVTAPQAGTWRINTDPDPDNRVMIVTDLKLKIDEVPSYLMADEILRVRASITENGAPVLREDFLDLLSLDMAVATVGASGAAALAMPFDASRRGFIGEQVVAWPAGNYELVVRVDGGTFRREQRAKIRIAGAPFTFASEIGEDGQSIELVVRADPSILKQASVSGLAVVAAPEDSSVVFDLPDFHDNATKLIIPAAVNGPYSVQARVVGATRSDRILNIKSPMLAAEISRGTDPVVEVAAPVVVPESEIDWTQSAIVIVAGNTVLFVLLGLVWFLLGRKSKIPADGVVLE